MSTPFTIHVEIICFSEYKWVIFIDLFRMMSNIFGIKNILDLVKILNGYLFIYSSKYHMPYIDFPPWYLFLAASDFQIIN